MIKPNSKGLKVEEIQEQNGTLTIKISKSTFEETNPPLYKTEVTDFEHDKISQEQAAKMFNVTVQTIINWRKRGLIKRYKIGHPVFYRKSELLEAASSNSLLQKI